MSKSAKIGERIISNRGITITIIEVPPITLDSLKCDIDFCSCQGGGRGLEHCCLVRVEEGGKAHGYEDGSSVHMYTESVDEWRAGAKPAPKEEKPCVCPSLELASIGHLGDCEYMK